jgi:hypothetical protein
MKKRYGREKEARRARGKSGSPRAKIKSQAATLHQIV